MLTDDQKQQVSKWIADGLKLSEIQDRLASEYAIRLTYMDARLLVDDLRLTPLDPVVPEEPKPAEPEAALADPESDGAEPSPNDRIGAGGVTVAVDSVTRPGAVVSGRATFSDGEKAEWYLDQTGRLGFIPTRPGYRPPQSDLAEFQLALDQELSKMGL